MPEPGNPQDLNRYAYVRNNPINHADPTGHCMPDINCPGDDNRCSGGRPGICDLPGGASSGGSSTATGVIDTIDEHFADLDPMYDPAWIFSAQFALCHAFGCYSVHHYYGPGVIIPGVNDDIAFPASRFKFKPRINSGGAKAFLPDDIAKTFKKGIYEEVTLPRDLRVRRVIGGTNTNPKGRYWTTDEVVGSSDAIERLALPAGNTATGVVEGIIPKGTTIYIGKAEKLQTALGTRQGGGQQIFLDYDSAATIVITGTRTLK